MLTESEIRENIDLLDKNSKNIKIKSEFNFILSDPTRIKILFLLEKHKELCVTDLSKILKISMSAVSHQLSLLEKTKFVRSVKMGQIVCYLIDKNNVNLNLDVEVL